MNARSIETVLFSALLLLSACAAGTNGAKDAKEAPAALLPNAHRVSETLVTGGQPSKAQLERLKEEGFTTVISLRTDAEPGAKEGIENAKALGFKVVHIPVAGAKGVTEENARKVAEALAAADGKVVLHCASGNRAGAMVALKAYYVDGKSVEEALRLGRAAGLTHLEEAVRQHLLEAEKARQSSKGAAAGAAETPEDAPAPDATDSAEE